jgi:hypothetical protein
MPQPRFTIWQGCWRVEENMMRPKPLYKWALEKNETGLGENHPHIATSLNSQDLLLNNKGKYDEVKPLYEGR